MSLAGKATRSAGHKHCAPQRIVHLLGIALALAACSTLPPPAVDAPLRALQATPEPTPPATSPRSVVPPASTPEAAPPPPVVLGFAGDTSFTHGLERRDPFGAVADLLAAPDLLFVNLETAIAEAHVGVEQAKQYTFRSPPESTGLLVAAGIDGVALANNHTLDYALPALVRTMELLDAAGIAHAGAGANEAEAYAPALFDVHGRTVALLSFTRVISSPTWAASGDRPGLASAYDHWVPRTVEAVAAARARADVVVVMVHWGRERERCPEPYQRRLAATWAEAGADAVIGSHPHVLQGIERIGTTWVVHSTGNFAFPSAGGPSARSAIFTIAFGQDESILRAVPVDVTRGVVVSADADLAADIRADLSRHSFGWRLNDAGVALDNPAVGACGP